MRPRLAAGMPLSQCVRVGRVLLSERGRHGVCAISYALRNLQMRYGSQFPDVQLFPMCRLIIRRHRVRHESPDINSTGAARAAPGYFRLQTATLNVIRPKPRYWLREFLSETQRFAHLSPARLNGSKIVPARRRRKPCAGHQSLDVNHCRIPTSMSGRRGDAWANRNGERSRDRRVRQQPEVSLRRSRSRPAHGAHCERHAANTSRRHRFPTPPTRRVPWTSRLSWTPCQRRIMKLRRTTPCRIRSRPASATLQAVPNARAHSS